MQVYLSVRYIVEILRTVAGGAEELRCTPMMQHSEHEPDWLEKDTQREIHGIVAAAERELLS